MTDNLNNNFINTIVLMEVLKILRNDENRKSRRIIYETYLDSVNKNNIIIFQQENIRKYVDKINGDFDEIGFLMESGYLNELPFFELYSDVICRLWKILNQYIQEERVRRQSLQKNNHNTEKFLHFFEKLVLRAKKYRKKNGLHEPTITDLRYKVEKL